MTTPQSRPHVPSPDESQWDSAASALAVNQASAATTAAQQWTTTFTTLLGLVGTVTLVKGTDELDKFDNTWPKVLLVLLTLGAAGLATKAVWIASETRATHIPNLNGAGLQAAVIEQTTQIYAQLRKSKLFGAWAIGLVGVVALLSLGHAALPAGATDPTSVVVVGSDGKVHCGKLGQDGGVDDVAGVSSVTVVTKCKSS